MSISSARNVKIARSKVRGMKSGLLANGWILQCNGVELAYGRSLTKWPYRLVYNWKLRKVNQRRQMFIAQLQSSTLYVRAKSAPF